MKWDWQAIVAVILATGVSGSIIVLSVGELFHNGHITDVEATTISTVLGAGIGAIATYLGTTVRRRRGDQRDDHHDHDRDH